MFIKNKQTISRRIMIPFLILGIIAELRLGSHLAVWAATPHTETITVSDESALSKSEPLHIAKATNFTYNLENGILTFSGSGNIIGSEENYMDNPWYALRNDVTSLVFEEGIKSIGDYAFCNFDKVTSISFSEGQSIGFRAFAGCSSLKEVTLPDQMPYMGGQIFADCTALEKVIYGQLSQDCSVYYIGHPFCGDINLQEIVVPQNNFLYEAKDNVLFLKKEKILDLLAEVCEDDVVKNDLDIDLFETDLLDS